MYIRNYFILWLRQLFILSSTRSSRYPILLKQHSAMSIQGPVCDWRHLTRGSEFMRHRDLRLPPQMSSRETSQGLEDIILFSRITITFCVQEWSILDRAPRFPGHLFPLLWNSQPSISFSLKQRSQWKLQMNSIDPFLWFKEKKMGEGEKKQGAIFVCWASREHDKWLQGHLAFWKTFSYYWASPPHCPPRGTGVEWHLISCDSRQQQRVLSSALLMQPGEACQRRKAL